MEAVASTSAGLPYYGRYDSPADDGTHKLRASRRVHPVRASIPIQIPSAGSVATVADYYGSISSESPSTNNGSHISSPGPESGKNDEAPVGAHLFPVSNGYAAVTAGAVVLYSATFLFYAQRHTVVLLIMTGLIGVFIIFLYALGILSFIYLMMRINTLEANGDGGPDGPAAKSQRQNIAYITVNNSFPMNMSDTTLVSNNTTSSNESIHYAPPARTSSAETTCTGPHRTHHHSTATTNTTTMGLRHTSSVTEVKF